MRPFRFAVNCEEAYPLLSGGAEYSSGWIRRARVAHVSCPYVGVVPAQLSPSRGIRRVRRLRSGGEDPFAQLEAALAWHRVHPDAAAGNRPARGFAWRLRGLFRL